MARLHCSLSWSPSDAARWSAPPPPDATLGLEAVEVRLVAGALEVSCSAPRWKGFRASLDHAVGLLLHAGQRPHLEVNALAAVALRDGLCSLFLQDAAEAALLDEALWAFAGNK